jgi:hypothetical protein
MKIFKRFVLMGLRLQSRCWSRAYSRRGINSRSHCPRAGTIYSIPIAENEAPSIEQIHEFMVRLRDIASRLSPRQIEHYPLLLSVGSAFWQILFAALSYLITVALFVLVYKFMPRAQVTLKDSLPGAFLGGLLWELAKYIFAWSLSYFHYDQIYGSVGAVVAVLTWSYVSSLILLFGAQLTAVFHREHPSVSDKVSDLV